MQSIEKQLSTLIERSPFKGAVVNSVTALTGDASDRGYFRIELGAAPITSAILMLVTKNSGPLVAGVKSTQDQAFLKIGALLEEKGISAAKIYADATELGAILVEDCGDISLAQTVLRSKEFKEGDPAKVYFEQAIDELRKMQLLAIDSGYLPFQRSLTEHEYRTEAQRFIDFYLIPLNLGQELITAAWELISEISKALAETPKVLAHRDFMPWNLHISGARVKIIDYQDAALATPLYDLISLLHDRDIDTALGPARIQELAGYYRTRANLPLDFNRYYYLTLLQRSLRLAGQFRLLSVEKGRPQYSAWIPGCLFRIGWCLRSLGYESFLEKLRKDVPEVESGASDSKWLAL